MAGNLYCRLKQFGFADRYIDARGPQGGEGTAATSMTNIRLGGNTRRTEVAEVMEVALRSHTAKSRRSRASEDAQGRAEVAVQQVLLRNLG